MAVKNSISIYIDGINYDSALVIPVKVGELLDERLDECTISLRNVRTERFAPMTPVELVITNDIYWGKYDENKVYRREKATKYFLVADDAADESILGKGFYNHDLALIEVTRAAELVVVDTITFTNDIGRNYAANAKPISPNPIEENIGGGWDPKTPSEYVSPLATNTKFLFVSAKTIFPYESFPSASPNWSPYYIQTVRLDGIEVFNNLYAPRTYSSSGASAGAQGQDVGFEEIIKNGTYEVYYECGWREYIAGTGSAAAYTATKATYTFRVVPNVIPLKKWTVTEVLNRLFDLAEPLHIAEKPRFRLQGVNDDGTFAAGSQAEKFDKILAPEFAFTKQTLRECLKQIGGFIHGEPRLTPKKDGSGTWYYEVSYDMYGGTEQWRCAGADYIENTVAYTAEQFATAIDTNPENLINKLKDYTGVTMEPDRSGSKSVRTEQMYVQITETNMLISTQRPIYTVEKVEYVDDNYKSWDITPYIFESSVYNSQLSSYESQYPYSKAYGLMYTQGEKNITALNFKQEHPLSEVFSRYAIVNILREAMSDRGFTPPDYAPLFFRVTYTPIYNARVKQVKPNYKEYGTEATQIYNQTANLIESRAFGENLKGVIARMGNPEISHTYMFASLSEIPKAGMKFDDDYYISGVFTEFYTPFIRCTVALTKDFNRISAYIGIPQYKRYSQISQNMAVERNIIYEEYVVIGDGEDTDYNCMIGDRLMSGIVGAITQGQDGLSLTMVTAWGGTYQNSNDGFNVVDLSVVASAYGNSISFSWEYADNYSAGERSSFQESDGTVRTKVSGYFQQDYPYADYYGRMYYYNFDLKASGNTVKLPNYPAHQGSKPNITSGYISTLYGGRGSGKGDRPFIVRKDNREKLQFNVQVHYVTNRKGLIIGSALASNCLCVRSGRMQPAKLYVLPERIDKFTENLEAIGVLLEQCPSAEISATIGSRPQIQLVGGNTFPASGKAWVIASPPVRGAEEQVENEKGEEMTVARVTGGDLLLGQNMDISAGQTFAPIYFTKKRNVYKGVVWKDRR